ncbi:hypothetical protein ACFS4T_21205 [Pseudomonas lini]
MIKKNGDHVQRIQMGGGDGGLLPEVKKPATQVVSTPHELKSFMDHHPGSKQIKRILLSIFYSSPNDADAVRNC